MAHPQTPRRQVDLEWPPRSWALEMMLRIDDHEMWVSDAVRFPTEASAQHYGDLLLATRPVYTRYRLIPSRLPATLGWLLPS
jgi:hypothetical protein